MLSKLLLSLSLLVSPIVSVSAQAEYTEFDTYQHYQKYDVDFDYVNEASRRFRLVNVDGEVNYAGNPYRFYVFPIYYDINISDTEYIKYYENDYYQFFTHHYSHNERNIIVTVDNYVGVQTEFYFYALDYVGMFQVIEHDKTEKSNSISIYNSFYNFFTGFFPNEVVVEYHGIFTFVIVAFLLFLVFGFVFFLFRVIRRLVGFK